MFPGVDSRDWKTVTVYMVDFEGSPSSGVVEYGVVALAGAEIHSTETALCLPVGRIGERDREVHGISESLARGHPPFSSLYDQFVGYRRSGILAAHNRHAENTFLKDTWPIPPRVPDWRGGPGEAQEWGPWIDTLSIYRALYPGLESYGLGELAGFFRCLERIDRLAKLHCPEGRRRSHCALYDALASAVLLLRLEETEDLRNRMSLEWLLLLSQGRQSQQELF